MLVRVFWLVVVPLVIAFFLIPALHGSRRTGHHPRLRMAIYQSASGGLVAASDITGDEDVVALANYFVSNHTTGFPARVATHTSHRLYVMPDDPATKATYRAAVAAYLSAHANDPTDERAQELAPFAAKIAVGDFTITTPHAAGYVLNAAFVVALVVALFALVLWCLHRIRLAYRAAVRTARAAVGLCPNCGYETRDLMTGTCPECGESHAVSAPTPPA